MNSPVSVIFNHNLRDFHPIFGGISNHTRLDPPFLNHPHCASAMPSASRSPGLEFLVAGKTHLKNIYKMGKSSVNNLNNHLQMGNPINGDFSIAMFEYRRVSPTNQWANLGGQDPWPAVNVSADLLGTRERDWGATKHAVPEALQLACLQRPRASKIWKNSSAAVAVIFTVKYGQFWGFCISGSSSMMRRTWVWCRKLGYSPIPD